MGTPGTPVAASEERRRRHRGRVVVFHGRGHRHIPGGPGPSLSPRAFRRRKLREKPRRRACPAPVGRRRAVQPFSRDIEDRGERNADRPSLAERVEAVSGNGRCADICGLPAQRGRYRTGFVVAGFVHRGRSGRRALAGRQLAPRDRGPPRGRSDNPEHDGAAVSGCGSGLRRLSCASGPAPGCHSRLAIGPGTHRGGLCRRCGDRGRIGCKPHGAVSSR